MIVGHTRITNTPNSLASIRGYLKADGENEEVILHYDEDEEDAFFGDRKPSRKHTKIVATSSNIQCGTSIYLRRKVSVPTN